MLVENGEGAVKIFRHTKLIVTLVDKEATFSFSNCEIPHC